MLSSTGASARSMERNLGTGTKAGTISWPTVLHVFLLIVQRQQAHLEQLVLRRRCCTPAEPCHGSVRLLQPPCTADQPKCQRKCKAWTVAASLAEQTATFTYAQSGLQAGKVRGCCNQTASQPTVKEADNVSRVPRVERWKRCALHSPKALALCYSLGCLRDSLVLQLRSSTPRSPSTRCMTKSQVAVLSCS